MRPVVAMLLAMAGVAAGASGVTLFAVRSQRSGQLQQIHVGIEALQRDIIAIRRLLTEKLLIQEAPAVAPEAVRTEALESDGKLESLQQLNDRIQELTVKLEAGLDRLATENAPESKAQDVVATARLRDAVNTGGNSVADYHFSWTPRHVYLAYGRPNGVTRSGQSILWTYFPDESDDGVQFEFEDGLVTRVRPWRSPNPRR